MKTQTQIKSYYKSDFLFRPTIHNFTASIIFLTMFKILLWSINPHQFIYLRQKKTTGIYIYASLVSYTNFSLHVLFIVW